jgi:hypothetical protein
LHLQSTYQYDPKQLPPITKWNAERKELTAEKSKLYQEYAQLKEEIREVEIIRKSAEEIARTLYPQPSRRCSQEIEI